MKKFFIVIVIVFSLLLVSNVLALNIGQDLVEKAGGVAGYSPATDTTIAETIGVVIKALLSLVGVIFLVLTVFAGIKIMGAQGEEEKVKSGVGTLKTAVIGLIITVGAYSITAFVVPVVLEKTTGPSPVGSIEKTGSPVVPCCEVCGSVGLFGCGSPKYSQVEDDVACKAKCTSQQLDVEHCRLKSMKALDCK